MRARLALATGDLDAARVALRELQRLGENVAEPQSIEPRAEIEADAAGRAHALGERYEPALDGIAAALREGAGDTHNREARAWRAMADAELTRRRALLGEAPADAGAWDAAARAFDALALPLLAAYARFRAGEALVAAGDRAGAAAPLRAAAATARETGAALIGEDVAALAR